MSDIGGGHQTHHVAVCTSHGAQGIRASDSGAVGACGGEIS